MPFDTRPTEPAESTDLDDVESALEDAETALRALDELSTHPGMARLRSARVDRIGDALTALRDAIESLTERRRDLDGTTAAECRADRIYDEMRDEGWR